MTHIDGTASIWSCCNSWECVCALPEPFIIEPLWMDDEEKENDV